MSWDPHNAKRIIIALSDLLEDIYVPFFLIQGTALGAYRDRGFTPTEEDIDFGFLQEHFTPKANNIAQGLKETGFSDICLISKPFTRPRTITASKYGIHIDLVSYMSWKDKRFATRPLDHRNLQPYSIVHNRYMLERYNKVTLFGKQFNVPHPIEDYLALEYGDWKIPAKDHVSRTRVYGFVKSEGIPLDLLELSERDR